ncbi:MAG: GNAT family N-acetyltransferase [Anaerolineae bacterium]|nr:MAG: GNAT family N-acetyltransferase [Anaerolineae bacterium]
MSLENTLPQLDTGIRIKRADWRDLGAVRQLEEVCFPLDSWPLLEIIGILTMPGVVRLKAMDGEKTIGFVAGEYRRAEGLAWIATICVHPDERGRGVGRTLLAMCESRLRMPRVRLTVRESNAAAIEMYRQAGYTEFGRWPRYYRGGEDGLVMEKILDKRR